MWKVIIALLILASCGKTELKEEQCADNSKFSKGWSFDIDNELKFRLWWDSCKYTGYVRIFKESRPNHDKDKLYMSLTYRRDNKWFSSTGDFVIVGLSTVQIYYQDSLRVLPIN